jgi:hypothetical protein
MPTNVPSPVIGPLGVILPQESDVLAGVQADINAAFGGGLNMDVTTPQGQWASTISAIIADRNNQILDVVSQVDPQYAQGRMQDAIGFIYFLDRDPARATLVKACTCTGLAGTVIPPNAQAVDTSGNIYLCSVGGTIPISGTISLDFFAFNTGPQPCPAHTLAQIYVTIPGWSTIDNPKDGVIGADVETQQAFELRRQASVAINASATPQAIYAAVSASAPVGNPALRPTDVYVFENNLGSNHIYGGVTLIPNSTYVCAAGGDSASIAAAYFSKHNPGCNFATGIVFMGSTATDVLTVGTMISGVLAPGQTIKGVEIPTSASFTGVGATVTTSPLTITFISPLAYPQPIIAGMTLAIGGTPVAKIVSQDSGATGGLGIYELDTYLGALATEAMTLTNIVDFTGSIASGGPVDILTVTAVTGTIPVPTGGLPTLISGAGITSTLYLGYQVTGSPGGTGTYTLSSVGLTIGSEAMQATVSYPGIEEHINIYANTTIVNSYQLTASAVTGVIEPGQVLTATGAAPNTHIVAQLSGTPGDAGVYTLDEPFVHTSEACSTAGINIPETVTIQSQLTGGPPYGGVGTYQLNVSVGTSSSAQLTAGIQVQVPDTSYPPPYPTYDVLYCVPTDVPILFAVQLKNLASLPSDIVTQTKNAIVSAFAGGDGGPVQRIGTAVNASRYYAPIGALSPSVNILSLLVGTATPTLPSVQMNINQRPTIDPSNITVSLV